MKKRTQLIILSVLIFICLVVVLSSSIFSFSEVGIDKLTTTINLNITKDDLYTSSKFEYGKSIFSLNKNLAKNNIEKDYPFIKVVNIETVFPNKVIFHVAERQELFSVKYNNKYLILDEEGKVLSVKDNFINTAENAILLCDYNVNNTEFHGGDDTKSQNDIKEYLPGEFIDNKDSLIKFATCLKEWKLSFVHLRAHITSVQFDNTDIILNMRCGLNIKVFQFVSSLSDKLNLAFSIYEKAEDVENKTLLEIRSVKNKDGVYELKGFIS